MRFFVGLHQCSDAQHFDECCISIVRLKGRKKPLGCKRLMIDSGAFSEIAAYGEYRHSVREYAEKLLRLHDAKIAHIELAVSQDYMCEDAALAKTGLTVLEHQKRTVDRYDQLRRYGLPFHILPILQGRTADDYVAHLAMYQDLLCSTHWIGLGSVCKRKDPLSILAIQRAVHAQRPGLRLHGFGVKLLAFANKEVGQRFYSADSMAWSFAARYEDRDANDWREAREFTRKVYALCEAAA